MIIFVPPSDYSVEKTQILFPGPDIASDIIQVSTGPTPKLFKIPAHRPASAKRKYSWPKLECTPESFAEDNVPIKSFRMPKKGWQQTRRSSKWAFGGNTGYSYEFAPKSKHEEAGICIDWDGRIILDIYRAYWRDIFTKPAHELEKGELVFLDEVIRLNHADPDSFKLTSAKTINWNGRMVVETHGQTIAEDRPVFHSFAITFDNYGDLRSAGVIRFSATKELFEKYKGEAKKSMQEIEWASSVPAEHANQD